MGVRAFFAQAVTTKEMVLRTRENPWGYFYFQVSEYLLDHYRVFNTGNDLGKEIETRVKIRYRNLQRMRWRGLAKVAEISELTG